MGTTQTYANPQHERAMNFPLHREVLDEPRTVYSAPVPDCEETMGLFGSGVFWLAGLVCVGLWSWLLYYVAVMP